MGEIKQTNFRIDQEAANAFRSFCEKHGMNQAQGFDHVMNVVEMDQAKSVVPERKTEIETVEKALKDIMSAYLNSIEISKNTEDRVNEQYRSLIKSKDKTIEELQTKVTALKNDLKRAEETVINSHSTVSQAVKDAKNAIESSTMMQQLLKEKERTIDALTEQLSSAVKKAEEFDSLSEENEKMQEEINDLKANMERQNSDAKKDTDLAIERAISKAVAEKEKELMERIILLEKENTRMAVTLDLLGKK